MSTELVERLRAGPIRTGDSENGEYELFDIEEAAQTMAEAADELTALTAKVALLTEALKQGLNLVSDGSGWGTVWRMEGHELYEDAQLFADAARRALSEQAD